MIRVENLTKTFGSKTAVRNLSFDVEPGKVTGFVGPNGAGKSTTMRCILGLDRPTAGTATIDGVPYARLKRPAYEVGALLDAKAFHGGRTARNHLLAIAISAGIPTTRVDEVLATVGLTEVARKTAGGFSMGMGQRLCLAAALLGDPKTLILDEPTNGLDPEGIRWIRDFMRSYADAGRSVLVSSHLLSELENSVDNLVIIGRGELITAGPADTFIEQSTTREVLVRTPQMAAFNQVLAQHGALLSADTDGACRVANLTAAQIGELAAANSIVLHELTPLIASLEDAFLKATQGAQEYQSGIFQPPTLDPS